MTHDDAMEILRRLARRSARIAIMNGENPMTLLCGLTGSHREIMRDAIVSEMRDAVQRVSEDFAFYRKMNAELRVIQ